MDHAPQESGGLLATGKRILGTVYSLAETRLELFLLELQEERIRLFDALLLVGLCLVCSLMALVLLTVTVVMVCGENYRLPALVLLTLAYASGAGWSAWKLRRRLQQWQSFAATLEQFRKDQSCLEKPN